MDLRFFADRRNRGERGRFGRNMKTTITIEIVRDARGFIVSLLRPEIGDGDDRITKFIPSHAHDDLMTKTEELIIRSGVTR